VTVSLAVLVAVMVVTLKPPDGGAVVWVTPALKVGVSASLYFSMTTPDPPLADSPRPVAWRPPPPPPPVLAVPFVAEIWVPLK